MTIDYDAPVDAKGFDTLELWEREYREIRSIPSSTRSAPSKALLIAEPLIDFLSTAVVLDAGCGNGRNAVHLAAKGLRVIAADFSPAALNSVACLAGISGLRRRIDLTRIDLNGTLPFTNASFDLCIDSYVSCHFTRQETFDRYWAELARVTRPGGRVFTSMFSHDDEYYDVIAREYPNNLPLVTDPHNGITKRLYREDEFKHLFRFPFSIANFIKFQFLDNVLGHSYWRSLLVALLRKTE